jgi:hypothetical protein
MKDLRSQFTQRLMLKWNMILAGKHTEQIDDDRDDVLAASDLF